MITFQMADVLPRSHKLPASPDTKQIIRLEGLGQEPVGLLVQGATFERPLLQGAHLYFGLLMTRLVGPIAVATAWYHAAANPAKPIWCKFSVAERVRPDHVRTTFYRCENFVLDYIGVTVKSDELCILDEAHGLIFGKIYTHTVCVPQDRYKHWIQLAFVHPADWREYTPEVSHESSRVPSGGRSCDHWHATGASDCVRAVSG